MTGSIDTSIELLKAALAAEKLKVGDTATPEAMALIKYLLDSFPAPDPAVPRKLGRAASDLNCDQILTKMGGIPGKRLGSIPEVTDEAIMLAMVPLAVLTLAMSAGKVHYETRRDGTRVVNPLFEKFHERYGRFVLTH